MAVLHYVCVDVPPDDSASQMTYCTIHRYMDTLHYVGVDAPSYYSDA